MLIWSFVAPPKDVVVVEPGLVVLLLAPEGEREDGEQKEEAPAREAAMYVFLLWMS